MSELIRIEHENGVVTYQSPLLREANVPHCFTTRIGGISRRPYDSLNLATSPNDPNADASTNVAENFRRVRLALNCRQHIRVQVSQVHGCNVWQPPAEPVRPADAPQADAIITDKPGLLLTIRIADCVPVLLASSDGRVVSAVHAGWRGIVAGVVPKAANELMELASIDPSQVIAAIGPCIGVKHFEVGPEVVEAFASARLQSAVNESNYNKPHIDLANAVRLQLQQMGIVQDRIDHTDQCTFAGVDEFFSHRRDDGRTGRQAAMIAAGNIE